MEDPTLIIAATGPLAAAIFFINERLRNRKKNNPNSLHKIHLSLTRIEEKLERLKSIEEKLDELGRR